MNPFVFVELWISRYCVCVWPACPLGGQRDVEHCNLCRSASPVGLDQAGMMYMDVEKGIWAANRARQITRSGGP